MLQQVNITLFLLQEQLVHYDFRNFTSLKPNLLKAVDEMLANDIAHLMAMIPQEATTVEPLVEGQDSGEFIVPRKFNVGSFWSYEADLQFLGICLHVNLVPPQILLPPVA